jgi:hypothetical protein
LLIACALTGYQAVEYTGLYRWVSDLQGAHLGIYWPVLSLTAAGLPLIALAVLLVPGPQVTRKSDEDALSEQFETFEELGIYRGRQLEVRLRILIPVTACIALGVLGYGLSLPTNPPAPVLVDISALGAKAPPADVPVILVGGPVPEAVITRDSINSNDPDLAVVPVIGDQPVSQFRFFFDFVEDRLKRPALVEEFVRTGRMTGVLVRNSMDGELRAGYASAGAHIAQPYYVLERGYQTPHRRVLGHAGLAALVLALELVMYFFNRRRLARYRRNLEA